MLTVMLLIVKLMDKAVVKDINLPVILAYPFLQ